MSASKQTSKGGFIGLAVMFSLLFFVIHQCNPSHSSTTNSPTSTALATPTWTTPSLSPEEIQQQQQEQQQKEERQRQLEAQRLNPNTYNAISPHDYALMLKDPAAHMSEKIIVYGVVTQFDTATGRSGFRADTAAEPQDDRYGYQQNTMIEASDPSTLANVIQGDYVRMYVEVKGTDTYKTTIGGEQTVPKFGVNIIKVTYSPQQ
ncbi:MAG: hypothetical protein WBR28_21950 [Mycobacterium sp.]